MTIQYRPMAVSDVEAVFALLGQLGERRGSVAAAPDELLRFAVPRSPLSVVAIAEPEVIGAALGSAVDGLRCVVVRKDVGRPEVALALGAIWEERAREAGIEIPPAVEVVPEVVRPTETP